jgi:hypothetical protein
MELLKQFGEWWARNSGKVKDAAVSKQLTAIRMLFVVVVFVGCGPSRKEEALKKQDASFAELKRVQAAFGDLQIAVNAGVSQQEFSQRTNDTLVKIGDLQRSEALAESGFPAEKDKIAEIYIQFNHAAEIYTLSKQFFGPNPAPLGDGDEDMLNVPEYEMLHKMFPDAYEHGGYFTISSRSDTLKGLWRLAKEATEAASRLIDRLSAPSS